MDYIASRQLRNDTRGVLRRAEQGETIVITVDGKPAAELRAVAGRMQWMAAADFVARLADAQADPALRADLDDIAGEQTGALSEW